MGSPLPSELVNGSRDGVETDAATRAGAGSPVGQSPEASRDADVARRVRLGDVAAFEALFRTYHQLLFAFVLPYVESPHVAEEVVQDLFLNLWMRRAEWCVQDSVRGYLYGAARNEALKRVARDQVAARHRERVLREHAGQVPFAPPADEVTTAGELADALQRAVSRLPARRAQVYTLRWQHDLPLRDIAQLLGMTTKAVELALARATKAVRAELERFRSEGPARG